MNTGRYRWGSGVLLAALICAVLAVSGLDSTVSAQGATTDYDTDDDGLIEVASEAQLNAIRWDMDGSGVVDDAANATTYATAFPTPAARMGCPATVCTGYELAANITLTSDTGMGWEPIGNATTKFTATFDGNAPDYTIDSLFINRTTDNIGLFGATGATSSIWNVKLTSVNVTGNAWIGALEPQSDPPAAPTGLTASNTEHDSLTLTWDDPEDDSVTGYRILRGPDANSLSTLETSPISATTPAAPSSNEQDQLRETPKEKEPPQRVGARQAAAAITTAPNNWSLVPTGLNAGDRFRLIFLSSTGITPNSTSIATYNTFVQGRAAAGHTGILSYSTGFRVVGCTNSVDARDNTSTTGTGVPIYWLNGSKVADNYRDFYDSSWDDEANDKNESGANGPDTSQIANYPITGCNHNGTKARDPGDRESRALGAAAVRVGRPNSATASDGPIHGGNVATHSDRRPMYGLSGVFQVAGNVAPTIEVPIPNRTAVTNVLFTYTFPTNTFNDRNSGDTLTYVAKKADNMALPVWLAFDANTRTFSGTPTGVGTVSVKVTASDGHQRDDYFQDTEGDDIALKICTTAPYLDQCRFRHRGDGTHLQHQNTGQQHRPGRRPGHHRQHR